MDREKEEKEENVVEETNDSHFPKNPMCVYRDGPTI